MKTDLPKVAVCILTYNGKSILEKFLPSLKNINYNNCDIYLIDNASTDDTIAYTKANYKDIKLIINNSNLGFAGGYNEGLKEIKADYFLLLNNDVEVTPDFIIPVIEAMEKDEKIAVAQPKIKSYDQKTHFEYAGASGGYLDYLGYPFCRGRIFGTLEEDNGQYDEVHECAWASGCAFFIKSKLWHQFKGFDEDFFAHMEEIDLCWRLKNAGYKNFVYPQSTVYHLGGGTLDYYSPKKTYLNFRNNTIMLYKNLDNNYIQLLIIRFLLDIVSGFKEIISLRFKHLFAIIKAQIYTLSHIGKLLNKRKSTLALIEKNRIDKRNVCCIYSKSVVWKYFIERRKRYSEMN